MTQTRNTVNHATRWFMTLLLGLVVCLIAVFISAQYREHTAMCTVSSKVEINRDGPHNLIKRVNTNECGTFTVIDLPLRNITAPEAYQMYNNINIGEQYKFTYINPMYGLFSDRHLLVDYEPTYFENGEVE